MPSAPASDIGKVTPASALGHTGPDCLPCLVVAGCAIAFALYLDRHHLPTVRHGDATTVPETAFDK